MAVVLTLKQVLEINPDVCDVCHECVRVRFPDGDTYIINAGYIENPKDLHTLLFDWLSAHVNAVRNET